MTGTPTRTDDTYTRDVAVLSFIAAETRKGLPPRLDDIIAGVAGVNGREHASQHIDRLEARGWVSVAVTESGRRMARGLSVTRKGAAILRAEAVA